MPRNKRVFPFFLDGGVQEINFTSADNQTWNGTSSYIEVQGNQAGTIDVGKTDTYGRPIPHGTMLLVRKIDADNNLFTVDWTDEFTTTVGGGGDKGYLRNLRDAVLLLFKGPSETNDKGEWVNLTADISENNVYGSLTVGNTFTANGAARFNAGVYRRFGSADLNDAVTATTSQVFGGFITYTPSAGNTTITLPTAAQFVAAGLNTVQDSVTLHIYNDSATVQGVLQLGAGGTLSGSGNMAAGTTSTYLVRMTNVGSGTEAYIAHRI